MISVIESYSSIIAGYEVRRYRQFGGAYEHVAIIRFIDHSELHVRDYLFFDGERKYSFHWQNAKKEIIRRWDNSPHHPQIATFPFHLHTTDDVRESMPMTLKKVLDFINTIVSKR